MGVMCIFMASAGMGYPLNRGQAVEHRPRSAGIHLRVIARQSPGSKDSSPRLSPPGTPPARLAGRAVAAFGSTAALGSRAQESPRGRRERTHAHAVHRAGQQHQ